jgi:exonuclease III
MAAQPNVTTICYWNCRGITNKKVSLEDFLHEQKIDICGISETKLTPQTSQRFKKYKLFHSLKPDGTERLAILANRKLNYKNLNLHVPDNYPRTMVTQFFYLQENRNNYGAHIQ